MPLASMSNVTSTCGTPRGAAGSARSNWPASCCRPPSRARPGTRGSSPRSGCPRRSRRSAPSWSGSWCCGRSAGEHAAERLDAERERRHVEQQHVLDFAPQHAGLDRRADGHHLVGVDALVGSLPKNCFTTSAPSACGSCRRPGPPRRSRPAERPASFSACCTARRSLDQIFDERLELGARELDGQMLRPVASAVMNGRLISVCMWTKLDLGLLGGLL